MSKASDYAKMVNDRLEFRLDERGQAAYVDENGWLQLPPGALAPDDALRLAEWIIDTFGEDGE